MENTSIAERMNAAYAAFRAQYETRNPPPKRGGLPGVFWLAMLVVSAGAVAIAIRTYGAFLQAASASGLTRSLSRAEAIGAMAFVEGGVILYEAIRAHDDAVHGRSVNLRQRVMLAITLFIAISATAGLHQSLYLLPNGASGAFGRLVLWALALIQGLGGTAALWASGSVLGHLAATSAVAYAQWEAALNAAWEQSAAYLELAADAGFLQVSQRDRRRLAREAAASIASSGRPLDAGGQDAGDDASSGAVTGQPASDVARWASQPSVQRVLEWMQAHGYTSTRKPPVRSIAREVGVSRGTVSNAVAVLRAMERGEL